MTQPLNDQQLNDLLYTDRPPADAPLDGRRPGVPAGGRRPTRRVGAAIGLVAACAVGAVAFSAFEGPFGTRTESVPLPGQVTSVSVDVDSASVDVRYADQPSTEVTVTDQRRGHDLAADLENGRLVVSNKGSTAFSFFGFDEPKVTIRLPKPAPGAAALPVDLRTDAGSVTLQGDFGDVRARSQAGQVRLDGSFGQVTAQSDAGRVEVTGRADRVNAQTDAGQVEVKLPDKAPDLVTARSSAGRVEVDVPDGRYTIRADTDAGRASIENVVNDPNAPRRIEVHSNAGSVQVR